MRECATALLQVAKRERIHVFLVGHVTKSGDLAGGLLLWLVGLDWPSMAVLGGRSERVM